MATRSTSSLWFKRDDVHGSPRWRPASPGHRYRIHTSRVGRLAAASSIVFMLTFLSKAPSVWVTNIPRQSASDRLKNERAQNPHGGVHNEQSNRISRIDRRSW